MKTVSIFCVLAIVSLAGCADQKAQLLVTQKSFIATVDTLTAMKAAGKFNPSEVNEITVYIHTGKALLDQWYADVSAGKTDTSIITAFNTVLDEMIRMQASKK